MPRARQRRLKCNYGLPHVEPPPPLENYEGARWLVNSKTLDHIIYTQLRDVPDGRRLTPNYHYLRGDMHTLSCDLELLNDIAVWGRASEQPRSPEVTIPPDWIPLMHPNAEPIRVNEDGSAVIRGETGQCDNQASLYHADMIWYAILEGMGLDFCSGFMWQYAPRGHSPNWAVDNDLRFKIVQVRSDGIEVIDPQAQPELAIHVIYEA
jgi:hypothetical protein